jgi:hypothetical protein
MFPSLKPVIGKQLLDPADVEVRLFAVKTLDTILSVHHGKREVSVFADLLPAVGDTMLMVCLMGCVPVGGPGRVDGGVLLVVHSSQVRATRLAGKSASPSAWLCVKSNPTCLTRVWLL